MAFHVDCFAQRCNVTGVPSIDANRLRVLMGIAGISQAEMAQSVGVTEAYISQVVTGKRSLAASPARRRQIADRIKDEIRCFEPWWIEGELDRPPRRRRRDAAGVGEQTLIGLYLVEAYRRRHPKANAGVRSVARLLGINPGALYRPNSPERASELAERLNLTPAEVWPWFGAVVELTQPPTPSSK